MTHNEQDPCADVLRQMYYFIDNEMAAADSTEIQQHLDECLPCLREVDVEDLLGRSPLEFIAPEDQLNFVVHLQQTLQDGVGRDVEYMIVRKDGTRFPGAISGAVVRDASGKFDREQQAG